MDENDRGLSDSSYDRAFLTLMFMCILALFLFGWMFYDDVCVALGYIKTAIEILLKINEK